MIHLRMTWSLMATSLLIGCTSPDPPQPSRFIESLDLESEVRQIAVDGVNVSPEFVIGETQDRQQGSDTTVRMEATLLLSCNSEKLSEFVDTLVAQLGKRITDANGSLSQIELNGHNWDADPLLLDYSIANTKGSIRVSQSESSSTGYPRKLTVLIEESVRNP